MLNEPKIIYICDHRADMLEKTSIPTTVTRSSGSDTDTVSDATYIFDIISVHQFDDTGGKHYYKDVDYQIVQNIQIKWIAGQNSPVPEETYIVEYINLNRNIQQYIAEECPKCAGNGWYVSLFGDRGTTAKKVTGINKLVQDFIKVLFTIKDGTNYGSDILELSSQPMYREEEFATEAMRVVKECEIQIKQTQLAYMNAGNALSDEERLKTATITASDYDVSVQGFYITILLKNEAGNTAGLNLKV